MPLLTANLNILTKLSSVSAMSEYKQKKSRITCRRGFSGFWWIESREVYRLYILSLGFFLRFSVVFLYSPAVLWTFPSRHLTKPSSLCALCPRTESRGKGASANSSRCPAARCLWGGTQMKLESSECQSARFWITCRSLWRPWRCLVPQFPSEACQVTCLVDDGHILHLDSTQMWHLEEKQVVTLSTGSSNCLI